MPRTTSDQFPPPPAGKTGWPWTTSSPQLPVTMPSGARWPRISIVTPSYNQGQFIEETIRSVLLQGYPNLEYSIIDGGSTDQSVEIIKNYEPWLTYWVSEKDRGQSHAINKGFEIATGEIAAYLNSDDMYLPGALAHVGQTYIKRHFDVLVGQRKVPWSWNQILRRSHLLLHLRSFVHPHIIGREMRYSLPQECVFWDFTKYRSERFNEHYQCCMDVDWFCRIFSDANIIHSSRTIGVFRLHPQSKTARIPSVFDAESEQLNLDMFPWSDHIPQTLRQQIIQSYRYASLRALALHIIAPWRASLFHYKLPPYLR